MNHKSRSKKMTHITSKEDLKRLDGKQVFVIGFFRKSLTARKKRGVKVFSGSAHLEINTQLHDQFILNLGQRNTEDFEKYTDQKVKILGTIDFDPAARYYQQHIMTSELYNEPVMAMPISGPPALLNIQSIEIIR